MQMQQTMAAPSRAASYAPGAYSYADTLATSQRVNWRIEDIIGPDKPLDFSKPFMPKNLARIDSLGMLDDAEKLVLNHIRGHGYLYIFGLVEEFILPFVLDHARPHLAKDDARTRALLQFAGEEAKHIDLFKRFRREFQAGFGTDCEVIGPAAAIADAVLAHDPLAVALLILHIEWMSQRHYVDSVRDDQDLDPQFKSLLKHHWMEESQHAKLDTLMVEALAESRDAAAIDAAVDGYLALGGMIDGALKQQAAFDLDALTAATGRRFDAETATAIITQQHQAQRWTYIGSGMTHPNFMGTLQHIAPARAKTLGELAPVFC
ncbi:hypothetical protein [Dongia rigui]|uniref:Ferritin-like domain-containing protein n=1 Tax=Dongia rigui TaxID=940149 RepID=A0ABU5E3R7_9PROT|nr:hypothetical protein [Dongia rigui]MDY0874225.1 hypothetical protein [Dongia rigui]